MPKRKFHQKFYISIIIGLNKSVDLIRRANYKLKEFALFYISLKGVI